MAGHYSNRSRRTRSSLPDEPGGGPKRHEEERDRILERRIRTVSRDGARVQAESKEDSQGLKGRTGAAADERGPMHGTEQQEAPEPLTGRRSDEPGTGMVG